MIPAQENKVSREDYHYLVEGVNRIDVDIEYELGELIISANPKGEGEIEVRSFGHDLDDEDYDYDHDYDEDDEQDKNRWSFNFNWRDIRDGEYQSTADSRLPQSLPTDIQIEFGLGEARIDLSDLSISKFEMECGLGDTRIGMSTSNPVTCREASIEAGLGDLNVTDLGSLRTRELNLEIGLGASNVDLRGHITEDMDAGISIGIGSVDMDVRN